MSKTQRHNIATLRVAAWKNVLRGCSEKCVACCADPWFCTTFNVTGISIIELFNIQSKFRFYLSRDMYYSIQLTYRNLIILTVIKGITVQTSSAGHPSSSTSNFLKRIRYPLASRAFWLIVLNTSSSSLISRAFWHVNFNRSAHFWAP